MFVGICYNYPIAVFCWRCCSATTSCCLFALKYMCWVYRFCLYSMWRLHAAWSVAPCPIWGSTVWSRLKYSLCQHVNSISRFREFRISISWGSIKLRYFHLACLLFSKEWEVRFSFWGHLFSFWGHLFSFWGHLFSFWGHLFSFWGHLFSNCILCSFIQGVTGGTDQTSGGHSLC